MRATVFGNGIAEAFAAIFLAAALAPAAAPAAAGGGLVLVREPADDGDAYVLTRGESSFSTNGSLEDIESLRSRFSGDFLWTRRAGKEYVIRDSKTLAEARGRFAPLDSLEPDRADLERRQALLEKEQSALEREQEEVERRLDRISDEPDAEDDDADPQVREEPAVAADRHALEERQREVESRARALEARERELEPLERSIDDREAELERKAEDELWRLVDRAIESGLARPASRR